MKAWYASPRVATTLSVAAILSFVAYTLLESRYVLEQLTPGIAAATAETLFVLVVVGGWLWALLAMVGGRRGGIIAALVFTTIPALITLYDLVLYSPIPYGWPLLEISVWSTLGLCVITIAALVLRLRQSKESVQRRS